ncbi:mannose-6-phosphate isomerase [Globomyces pollinis-pini]|nr:mannose-6-phosphate isomerase [Globomyces pollinis-pini]
MHEIVGKIQNYDWGKLGKDSKAAQLASYNGTIIEADKPYAELWMGTHPNGPSMLKKSNTPLKSIVNAQTVSESIYKQYQDLPFLLKILSIRKALSIQAHPDKKLASKLHAEFPNIYKDSNHKPEMAVALTDFQAFIGFRPLNEIATHLIDYPEFSGLLGNALATESIQLFQSKFQSNLSTDIENNKNQLKLVFEKLQNTGQEELNTSIEALMLRIQDSSSPLDMLLKRLQIQFPNDVGIYCALLLNFVNLKPGQAIFLAANEPHAYLSGVDLVECMAASDNVVRSGLTPKFKDVKTLVEMLTYNYGPAESNILNGDQYAPNTKEYNPPIDEFSILQTTLSNNAVENLPAIAGPSIIIVTNGQGSIQVGQDTLPAKTGSIFFIEADAPLQMIGTGEQDFIVYRAFCAL